MSDAKAAREFTEDEQTSDFLPSALLCSASCSAVSDSLQLHRQYNPWNSPGQNTGVGSLPLLQGIFPTQRSNPGLPHCRRILYQLSHKGSPRMLEWVAYPFSSRSPRPRNQTRVSCIAGGFCSLKEAFSEVLHFDTCACPRSLCFLFCSYFCLCLISPKHTRKGPHGLPSSPRPPSRKTRTIAFAKELKKALH